MLTALVLIGLFGYVAGLIVYIPIAMFCLSQVRSAWDLTKLILVGLFWPIAVAVGWTINKVKGTPEVP